MARRIHHYVDLIIIEPDRAELKTSNFTMSLDKTIGENAWTG